VTRHYRASIESTQSSDARSRTNNTLLGYNSSASSATATNQTVIGAGATGAGDNTVQLGNTSVTNVKTSGNITAGAVTYPNTDGTAGQVLSTDGNGNASWNDSGITSLKNVSHNTEIFNTVGVDTDWTVPTGIYTIEIWLNGSIGGDGGNVYYGGTTTLYTSSSSSSAGGTGGTFGSATVILNVAPGDTITYYLGNDGSDGSNAYRGNTSAVNAEGGTAGESSSISLEGILGFRVSGGGGGGGGRVTSGGGPIQGGTGGQGSLDMSQSLNNGFFVRSASNPYSSSKSTLVIRY